VAALLTVHDPVEHGMVIDDLGLRRQGEQEQGKEGGAHHP
jgi:hypothetical protein